MKPYNPIAINIGFSAALLLASQAALADSPAGHVHTEAGHFPRESAAPAAYVDSEPPLRTDLGTLSYRITTADRRAQRYFDQGLRLAYAFNHLEAQRAFRRAQKLDPRCAMCFWGEALVLGPNINAPMDASAAAPAWTAIARAKALARHASTRERGLIEALSRRYARNPTADRKALDNAYAEAMGELAGRFPGDDQIAVLYAESLMDLSPWDYWEDRGRKPKGHTAEILEVLEGVLAKNPDHPGAIHYYIHAVEASDRPQRALPYAERLARLMPGSGHLVHMPGHLYYRLGRYRDALDANRAAIALDEAYLQETGARGFYAQKYYPHNVHFLMVSAQAAGDGKTALAAAEKLAALVSDNVLGTLPRMQPVKAAPYFAYAQFGPPEAVLMLSDPGSEFPYVRGLWRYARGVAEVAQGASQEAKAELKALVEIARKADFSGLAAAGIPAPEILGIAQKVLAARIAQAEGDLDSAIPEFDAAAALQDRLPYREPSYWYYPVRRSLGALRFLAGDLPGAEREFEASLLQAPNDAWALQGLAEVHRKRGNADAAAAIEGRLAQAGAGNGARIEMSRL